MSNISSLKPEFDPNDDSRFSHNSVYMNVCRINGVAHAAEIEIEDLLFTNLSNEAYLKLHSVLAMAKMCKALSGELLEQSDSIKVVES